MVHFLFLRIIVFTITSFGRFFCYAGLRILWTMGVFLSILLFSHKCHSWQLDLLIFTLHNTVGVGPWNITRPQWCFSVGNLPSRANEALSKALTYLLNVTSTRHPHHWKGNATHVMISSANCGVWFHLFLQESICCYIRLEYSLQ